MLQATVNDSFFDFFPPGLFLKNLCSGDGVAVISGAATAMELCGESVKVSLFLGLVLVGKSNRGIHSGYLILALLGFQFLDF